MEININMTLNEILEMDENNAKILESYGMHCLNCPMCQMETLADAIQAHEIDANELLQKLNEKK